MSLTEDGGVDNRVAHTLDIRYQCNYLRSYDSGEQRSSMIVTTNDGCVLLIATESNDCDSTPLLITVMTYCTLYYVGRWRIPQSAVSIRVAMWINISNSRGDS
jgi:hypothetical protein